MAGAADVGNKYISEIKIEIKTNLKQAPQMHSFQPTSLIWQQAY